MEGWDMQNTCSWKISLYQKFYWLMFLDIIWITEMATIRGKHEQMASHLVIGSMRGRWQSKTKIVRATASSTWNNFGKWTRVIILSSYSKNWGQRTPTYLSHKSGAGVGSWSQSQALPVLWGAGPWSYEISSCLWLCFYNAVERTRSLGMLLIFLRL